MRRLLLPVFVLGITWAAACNEDRKPPETTPSSAVGAGSTSSTGGMGGNGGATTGTSTATSTAMSSTATGTGCPADCMPACDPADKCVDIGNCNLACTHGDIGEPCGDTADCDVFLVCGATHFCECSNIDCAMCDVSEDCIPVDNCLHLCSNHMANAFCDVPGDCLSGQCVNHQCT